MPKVVIPVDYDEQCRRFREDLLYIANSKMYINEKGYLQKLIDLLFSTGYYETNESYFIRLKG